MKPLITLSIAALTLVSNLEAGCGAYQIKNNADKTKKLSNKNIKKIQIIINHRSLFSQLLFIQGSKFDFGNIPFPLI